jgi:hypothetical protein
MVEVLAKICEMIRFKLLQGGVKNGWEDTDEIQGEFCKNVVRSNGAQQMEQQSVKLVQKLGKARCFVVQ